MRREYTNLIGLTEEMARRILDTIGAQLVIIKDDEGTYLVPASQWVGPVRILATIENKVIKTVKLG